MCSLNWCTCGAGQLRGRKVACSSFRESQRHANSSIQISIVDFQRLVKQSAIYHERPLFNGSENSSFRIREISPF
jgi:hypothetical protein